MLRGSSAKIACKIVFDRAARSPNEIEPNQSIVARASRIECDSYLLLTG